MNRVQDRKGAWDKSSILDVLRITRVFLVLSARSTLENHLPKILGIPGYEEYRLPKVLGIPSSMKRVSPADNTSI